MRMKEGSGRDLPFSVKVNLAPSAFDTKVPVLTVL